MLRQARQGRAPIIIMVHGYKYDPAHPRTCPHRRIFSADRRCGWPVAMSLAGPDPAGPLCVAFAWPARGGLRRAYSRAQHMAPVLADLIKTLKSRLPGRPIHIIAHSLGAEIALGSLAFLQPGDLARMVLLAGASYAKKADRLLQTPAGRTAETINIVSRENDLFDHLFERLICPEIHGDRALGSGLRALTAATVELDCPDSLFALEQLGAKISPRAMPISHRSVYRRAGALAFYARLMICPADFSLMKIRAASPGPARPRWTRLIPPLASIGITRSWLARFGLAVRGKTSTMA
jgi:pimeloyl-ACP methyl ester carboxylesterase